MKLIGLLLLLASAGNAYERTVPNSVAKEAREVLEKLIAIDTTNPPGNELAVAKFVEPLLKDVGFETRVFESAPGRGNLWARLKGTGKKKTLLITMHTDVVGAPKEKWDTDPFVATEKQGYLYGRGAIDDKGMGAVAIAVVRHLAKSGQALDRDLILFFGADEEAGSQFGMAWMLKHHPELMKAEVVLNEGGGIGLEDGRVSQAAIQLYEKLYMNVTVSADGDSGHSSIPSQNNAVVRVARAVANIGNYRFPVKLNTVTRAYFDGLAKSKNHPLRKVFSGLVGKNQKKKAKAIEVLVDIPFYNASLRTTCTPTVFKAGFRSNAIAGSAEAIVNCRVLPDETRAQVLGRLRKAVDDPQIKLDAPTLGKPYQSPFKDPFFDAAAAVFSEMAPGAAAVPYMSAGATDSRKLREMGYKAYGLVPMPISADDKSRMHGDNERVKIESIDFGVEFLHRLIVRYAGAR
ncbi:MAG: peptidase M20 [Elusimicrobia bacterium]|nr:MAG: peptidase M20 [Elusimicrobiota bacterium]